MSLPLKPSESFKRRNPEFYFKFGELTGAKKMVRQSSKPKLNKLEADYENYLLLQSPNVFITSQQLSFRLANGLRYTPDFVVFDTFGSVDAHEVKGFMRDDAAAKLKVAATLFPFIKWTLAWKECGEWRTQIIIP
jgi:hypothetical protein